MAQNLKKGDKVWFYMNITEEIVSATVADVFKTPNGNTFIQIRFDEGGTVGGLKPNFDVFPTREALCEHYRKIFE